MTAQTLTYTGVTLAELASLKAKLIAGGAVVTTPAPETPNLFHITGHGITSDAIYDPWAATLTVVVISKPWIVSMERIDEGIKEALDA